MQENIYDLLKKEIHAYKDDIFKLTSELIKIESISGQEGEIAEFIYKTVKELGYDFVEIDKMGNVIAVIGDINNGKKTVAVDGHMDVVDYGDVEQWDTAPTSGLQDEDKIYGRGASDMKAAIAAMIYAGFVLKKLGLQANFNFMVCATVQEEPCEGLAWEYLIEDMNIRPDIVILGEPSNEKISLAQRGRMELAISVQGKSAHAANPQNGHNAIYGMANIVSELEKLNDILEINDPDLGKGCLVVSEISSNAPSRCSVADFCTISVDRRLTWGESPDYALEQIRQLPSVKAANAKVEAYFFTEASYTGKTVNKECIFPAWKIEKNSPLAQVALETHKDIFNKDGELTTWAFSTNGVAIMGLHNIPVIGYGPGCIEACHVANEYVFKKQIINSALFFAAFAYNFTK